MGLLCCPRLRISKPTAISFLKPLGRMGLHWSTLPTLSRPIARSCSQPPGRMGLLWSMLQTLSRPTERSCSLPTARWNSLQIRPQHSPSLRSKPLISVSLPPLQVDGILLTFECRPGGQGPAWGGRLSRFGPASFPSNTLISHLPTHPFAHTPVPPTFSTPLHSTCKRTLILLVYFRSSISET